MSDRLLSGVTGHTDYPGFGSYPDTGYGTPDPYGQAASGYDGSASYEGAQWTATATVPQVEQMQQMQMQMPQTQTQQPQQRDPWYDQQHTFAPGPWDTGAGVGYAAPSLHDAPTSTVPVLDQDLYSGAYAGGYDGGYPQEAPQYAGPAADYAPADGTWDGPADDAFGGEHEADQDLRETTAEFAAFTARDDEPGRAAAPDTADAPDDLVDVTPPQRSGSRGRRRSSVRPRARSAFLTVAAPSLCVLGVTAVATAATVNETTGTTDDRAPVAAPDPAEAEPIEANAQFDTQLVSLSAAADDLAERASRTQGRMDLEVQQEREAEEAAEEAARVEAARQKFFIPVAQHGLSAYYGQAGVNWMSQHTGIDFPVSYGSPVMAATDGTISTQWHPSYGNLVVLTAADGTETWYAHLDSSVYQSGWVQAGTVIAYSGNSGNSTGPHLHFEVRPGGGSAIDPLSWLRGHGLEPT
ncbi:M23 family metallopeptidase [Streptomyces sp. NPDC049881]|uniref:M23 family metallopeptidase n=1 Tax=Streptomyces sp. NPDC049881 TaxID=3155778 RepID=UPI00341BCC49